MAINVHDENNVGVQRFLASKDKQLRKGFRGILSPKIYFRNFRECGILLSYDNIKRVDRVIFVYKWNIGTWKGEYIRDSLVPLLCFDTSENEIKRLGRWRDGDTCPLSRYKKYYEEGYNNNHNIWRYFIENEAIFGYRKYHDMTSIKGYVMDYDYNLQKPVIYFISPDDKRALRIVLNEGDEELLKKLEYHMYLDEELPEQHMNLPDDSPDILSYYYKYGGDKYMNGKVSKNRK